MRYHITTRLLTTQALLMGIAVGAQAQTKSWLMAADMNHVLGYIVAAMIISVFVMFFYNRLFYFKEKDMESRTKQLNKQLALVLDANKTQIWTFQTVQKIYTLYTDRGQQLKEFTPIDFSQLYHHDDFAAMRKVLFSVRDQKQQSATTYMRSRKDEQSQERRMYEINISVLRRDRHGYPILLLGTQTDITEERKRLEKSRKLGMQYHTVFNSSLVDMLYYDENGKLADINDKACETFHINSREEALRRNTYINDVPPFRDIDFRNTEGIQASSLTPVSELQKVGLLPSSVDSKGMLYYEAAVNPIKDDNGQLMGIFTAGRNITEMVESRHHQQRASQLLQETTSELQEYISNINYSLKVSNTRLLYYYPDTHEMQIASDLNREQYRLTQLRAITLVTVQERRRARGMFRRMDNRVKGTFSATLPMVLRDKQGRNVYMHFNMMPITNKEGRVVHYFGMCRDESELTYTEMELRQETQKAQETELVKNSFLMNMSYEIRTPLNAVLGFAELFNGEHDEADEPIFAAEIKRNTGDLLQLINDILFISRLDAHMVEYNYKEADFALLFEGFCYMGLANVETGVNVVVENPYNHLVVEIDEQQVNSVIQKLCTNAANFTHSGTIRAKYEYRRGELSISVEDSGEGIDPETLPKVFDRFVRNWKDEHCGSGLDLPIVKELVEQMGGTIELQSELNKGTAAYVSIPCKMVSLEKK